MVDVGHKPDTERIAVARGEVHMKKETLDLIRAGQIKKGDVLTVAQIAGIIASKRTSEMIPLCTRSRSPKWTWIWRSMTLFLA